MPVFGCFPAENIIAVFDEPNQIGDVEDINAPRNAPAKNPATYLSSVYWHIDFFQYELAAPIQTVVVNHASLAGRQKFWGETRYFSSQSSIASEYLKYEVNGRCVASQRTLFTHGLGYEPLAFVAYNGRMLMPGVVVQTASQGRNRFVSQFATSSIIGLREIMNASQNALPAVTRTYHVMVFRTPAVDAALPLFGQVGESKILGRGKADTSRSYLKRTEPGVSTPFNIDLAPTVDIANGRTRISTGGSTTTEDGYNGGFSGGPFRPVST